MAKYNCPNLGDPIIKNQFDKLTQEFGEELAYYVWHNITIGNIKLEVKEEVKPVEKPTEKKRPKRNKDFGKEVNKKDIGDSSNLPSFIEPQIKSGVDFVFEQNPELSEIGTQQLYSQYLDTIFPDSKVKDIVYHGGKKGIESFNKLKLLSGEGANIYGKGFYFTDNKETAIFSYEQLYSRQDPEMAAWVGKENLDKDKTTYSILLNIKNPFLWDISAEEAEELSLINNSDSYEKSTTKSELKNGIYGEHDSVLHITQGQEGLHEQGENHWVISEPEQIHILGSKQDIEGFKEFVGKDSSALPSEGLSITSYTLLDNLQQENDIVNSLSSVVLSKIDKAKKNGETVTIENVLDTTLEGLQEEYEFFKYYSEEVPTQEDIADGAYASLEENKRIADRFKLVIDNFNEIIEDGKVGYVGFRERVLNKVESLKYNVLDDIDSDESEMEKTSFEDGWMFKVDAEDSMSAQVKRLLSFIPKRDTAGNTQSNTLGYKMYEDYVKVYSFIMNELVDIPIDDLHATIVQLSSRSAIAKDVALALDKLKLEDPQNYNKFHSVFRRQQANFITLLANPEDKDGKRSFYSFATNRSGAGDIVTDMWYENFKVTGLSSGLLSVNTDTGELQVNSDKAKELYKLFETNFTEKDFGKRVDTTVNALNQLGITITKEDLEILNNYRRLYNGEEATINGRNITEMSSKKWYKGKSNKYSRHFDAKTFNDFVGKELKPIFTTLTGELKDDSVEEGWQLKNPFYSQLSRIKGLTPYFLERNPDITSGSFRNGNGDIVQGYVMPHYSSNRMQKILHDEKFRDLLKTIPFIKNATWLNQPVKMEYFDSAKMKDSKQDSKTYAEQSPTEKEYTKLALFQNSNRETSRFIGNTPSDKTTFTLFETAKHILKLDSRNNTDVFANGQINKNGISLTSDTINTLYNVLVQSEINRIIAVRKAFNENKENLKKLIPGYHYLTDKSSKKTVIGSGGYFFFIPELNTVLDEFLINGQLVDGIESNLKFKEILRDKIVSLIQDKVDVWNERGIVNTTSGTNTFDKSYSSALSKTVEKNNSGVNLINTAAADLVVNYMLAYGNEFQLITGDPALFTKHDYKFEGVSKLIAATADNLFKRTAKDIAPGIEGLFEDAQFNTIFINEPKHTSVMTEYSERLGNLASSYKNMDIADAQEWTTLKEHLNVLHAYGKIDKATRDNLIKKAESRLTAANKQEYNFTWDELGTVLQPVKPVYVSSKYEDELQTDVHYYIKTSSYPLIPQLTEGFEVDKLRIAMESSNINRAVVSSGVKTGFFNSVSIFDTDGNVNIPANLATSIHTLPRSGFRIQQDVPYDAFKTSILEGSQLRKLKFANLTPDIDFNFNGEVKKGYELKKLDDKIHNKLYKMRYDKLRESLGIPEGENTITDVDKLRKLLADEAKDLGYTINDILLLTGSIKLSNGNTAFEVPLYFHNQSDKIESMLNSIIKNRILKNKMPGKSYVQGSSVGFVTKTKMGTVEFMNEMLKLTKQSVALTLDKDGNANFKGELEYREYEENGKKVIYGEVFAPFNFIREGVPLRIQDYIDESGFIKEDKLDSELLNILGYRIPTQGHSSMIKLKIVGFLPQEAGDLVIVPSAITKQMGSDFDVDKLYTHSYNYNVVTGGRLEKVDYTGKDFDKLSERELQNMSMDITYSILDNETVQNKFQFVLTDDPTLKNDKNTINQLKGTEKNMRVKPDIGTIIYDEYQSHMVEVNAAGKIGIGSYSSASANHILFQYAGVYLKVPSNSKGKLQPDKAVYVMFKDEKGNVYQDKLTGEDFEKNRANNKDEVIYVDVPTDGAWRLDKVYTFDGKLISDVIKSYQSSSVDNAKDQNLYDLHQNKHTFGVSALIARTGFNEYFINRFITQPAIIEYVKGLNNLDNYIDSEFVPDKQKKLQKEMFAKLGFDLDKWSYGITGASLSEMENSLKDNGSDKTFQAQMLWNFIKYEEASREVSRVQTSANTDTAYLGKSIYESLLKKAAIEEDKQFLGNTDNLFDETTQQGAIEYGLYASIDLFSGNNLFPLRSMAITNIFDTIKIELDKDIREDVAHNIFSDIRGALFTQAIKEVYGKDINELRKELLFGTNAKQSLSKRLKALQERTTNPFLKVLSVVTANKKDEPDVIEFHSSKEIKDELNMTMLLGWNQLLNSPEGSEERIIGEELAMYSLINGNQRTARDFGRFLPYDYISSKLSEYYRSLNFDNPESVIESLTANFVTQWFQHNPYKSREVKVDYFSNAQKFDGTAVKQSEVPDVITLKPMSDESMVDFYTYQKSEAHSPLTILYKYTNNVGKKDIALYKKDGDVYVKIPVLGLTTKLLKEYNIENPNQQSVFRDTVQVVNKKVNIELTPNSPTETSDLFSQYNFNGGIKSVLESIVAKGNNSMYKAVAQFYLKNFDAIKNFELEYQSSQREVNLSNLNSKYDVSSDLGRIWFKDNIIIINKDRVDTNLLFEGTVLHEITHALIFARLGTDHQSNKELQSIMKKLEKYKDLMTDVNWLRKIGVKKIGKLVASDSDKTGYVYADYIFSDTQEFAAALMTDIDLYNILNNIQYSKDKTFWDKLVEFINEILGIKEFLGRDIDLKEGSALTEGLATVLKIINDSDFNVDTNVKEEASSLPTQKAYPMKPEGRVFKLAINKDGEYIAEIGVSDNKRRIVNEYFRFRGRKDLNSKNLPYTEFSYDVASKDIALVHKINNLYTGRVVKYSPQRNRIMFTEDEANYKLKSEVSQFDDFSSSPSYVEEELSGLDKMIVTKEKQLEIYRKRLTDRGVNRDTIKSIISNLELQIKTLNEEKNSTAMEEVANKTLEAVNKSLTAIQEKIDANPSEDDLFVIMANLKEVDIYIEGMRDIDQLFDYTDDDSINRIDVLNANVSRARVTYLKQLRQAMTLIANKLGSERFADITEEELFANVEDVSLWARETLNMADSPSMLTRLLHQMIQLAKQDILEKQRDVATSVDNWEKKLQEHTKLKGAKLFDLFKQKYDDGTWTGNYIGKYKQEFFDTRANLIQKIKDGELTRADLLKWLKNNTTLITLDELESGKSTVFNADEMAEQAELYNKYKEDLAIQEQTLKDTYIREDGIIDEGRVSEELGKWVLQNDPKIYLDIYHNGKYAGKNIKNKGYKYLIYPKPNSQWVDKNFTKIESDPVLFGFYNFMKDTFRENNKHLPFLTRLQGNYLPEMTKTFAEKLKDKSAWEAFGTLGNEFWEAITDNVEGEIDYTIQIGNRKFKNIPTRMMMNKLTAKDKSDDIFKILKAHTSMSNSYQFKSKVEPVLTAGQQYLDEMQEITKRSTVKGKVTTKNMWKQEQPANSNLDNTKKQLEHQLEVFLYENYRDIEGRSKKVFLSEEDKAKVAELDAKLANEEITEAQYKTRVSTIGRQVTGTGVMDVVFKYTYLKALGLPNFMTPTVNLTFGLASNFTYAAGNQGTNLTDMRKAVNMFMGAVIDKKQLKKIWAFMEELGILNEYNESLYGTKRTMVDTMAFYLQNNTEKMNRGTLMLAHLLTYKVKNKNGDDVSLYHAFKEVEGKLVWDTDNFGEREELDSKTLISEHGVNMFRFKTLITKTNQRVHGDYDSALRIKRTAVGKMFSMFKTWIPMAIQERFGQEDYDDELGRMVKGRYTVAWTAKDIEGNEVKFTELLKLLATAAFKKDGLASLSEVDRASIRRNLKELQLIAQFAIAVAALSLVAAGDDDNEYKFMLVTMINLLNKAQADLSFFTNPSAMSQMTSNMIPIYSSARDIFSITDVMLKTISGDTAYKTGPLADQNRLLVWGVKVLPGTSPALRMWKNGEQVIENW